MKVACLFGLLFLALSGVVADYPYPAPVKPLGAFPSGSVGGNSIYYQSSDFINFNNVKNPITVSIQYPAGANFPASICFNSFQQEFPISGVNLESICPTGAFGTVSNNVMVNGTEFSDAPDKAVSDTVSAQLYVKPSANGGFIVTLPDAEAIQDFALSWEAEGCDDIDLFPVGSNSQCVPIANFTFAQSQIVSIGAGSWTYMRVTTPKFDEVVSNSFSLSINGTNEEVAMYIQEGYIPTADWHLNAIVDDEDDIQTATVLSPSTFSTTGIFYVGLFNSGDQTRQIEVNGTLSGCDAGMFGFDCTHLSTNSSSPVGGFRPFSATLVNGDASPTVNNGLPVAFDFSDDDFDNDYAYFQITNYPDILRPYVIRVSVGNNDIDSLSGAPSIFAKFGGIPSEQSNHYNISTVGDVAHQLTLPITDKLFNAPQTKENSWYVAVKLPADFSIWVGTNCANNCDQSEHGSCWCDDELCATRTNNGTQDDYVYYQRPSSLQDSAGICECDDRRYAFSFDCSKKNNGNSTLYIILIAIGGAIVLAVAIGVPVYCSIANKKVNSYDQI